MTKTTEDDLWKAAGVSSLSEVAGFPFRSHQALLDEITAGRVRLGIEPAAARNLAHLTKPAGNYALQFFMWIPFLLALGSLVLPFVNGNWLAVVGAVTAFIGMSAASPYNPRRIVFVVASVAALAYGGLSGVVTEGCRWAAVCFGASYLMIRFVNMTARNWAIGAVQRSEALAAYCFKRRFLWLFRLSSGRPQVIDF